MEKSTRQRHFFVRSVLEIYEGMTLEPPESSKMLNSVVPKFEEFCIGRLMKRPSAMCLTPGHRKKSKVSITSSHR